MRSSTSTLGLPSRENGIQLKINHPPGRSVPDRTDPDQSQQLGDVLATVAHGRCSPHRQRQMPQRFSLLEQMEIEQLFG